MGIIGHRGMKPDDKSKYTEEYIQRRLTMGYMTHPKYIIYNLFIFGWESDFLLCTKSGYWYEVEIKISLADFKNDFKHKKDKYEVLQTGALRTELEHGEWNGELHKYEYTKIIKAYPQPRPNYFSYCVPYYLVDSVKDLVPKGYGLYCVTEYGQIRNIIVPKRLHDKKLTDDELKLTEKFYYAYQTWRSRGINLQNGSERTKIKELKSEISWLRAEYKVATGYDIDENL